MISLQPQNTFTAVKEIAASGRYLCASCPTRSTIKLFPHYDRQPSDCGGTIREDWIQKVGSMIGLRVSQRFTQLNKFPHDPACIIWWLSVSHLWRTLTSFPLGIVGLYPRAENHICPDVVQTHPVQEQTAWSTDIMPYEYWIGVAVIRISRFLALVAVFPVQL